MLLGVAIVFLAVNLAVICPWYMRDDTPLIRPEDTPLRLLVANVHTSNMNHTALIDLVHNESPDVVALLEVNERWVQAVQTLCEDYPYHRFQPRPDNFGIGLLSRHPLENVKVREFGNSEAPNIVATVAADTQEITLIVTHLMPPVGSREYGQRNSQLDGIAEYIAQQNRPTIVAGDLNLTMWSWCHDRFLDQTGLKNARKGFGITPTWPTKLPLLFVPIDHCMCSKEIAVTEFRTAQRIGSDHLPIIVDLKLPSD